jgi:AcrR family transcriptional regulator
VNLGITVMGRADADHASIPPSSRRVITYEEVVAGACRHFLREATVDMEALATELAVSRATLYRVVEGRDRLFGDVLWSLGEAMLCAARRHATSRGIDGILEVSRRFYESVIQAAPFRRFLASEPQTAVRVLFTPAGRVHERAVRAQKEIFVEAMRGSGVRLAPDLDSLAYLYVRIFESMLYADLLSGRAPDLDLAERAARAILKGELRCPSQLGGKR